MLRSRDAGLLPVAEGGPRTAARRAGIGHPAGHRRDRRERSDFAGILKACIGTHLAGNGISPVGTWWRSCARNLGPSVDSKIAALRDGGLADELQELYRDIRRRAPHARVVVVDYPQFFPADGFGGYAGCHGFRSSDQVWVNEKIRQANGAIGRIATRIGFERVSMTDVLAGHHLCTHIPGINGVTISDGSASFHPNALGHGLMADRLVAAMSAPVRPTFVARSLQTVTTHVDVEGTALDVGTLWPIVSAAPARAGGVSPLNELELGPAITDVVTSLISPSGIRYTRDDPRDAEHEAGPTYEFWTIADPEPGTWTVETFGADVPADGLGVLLTVADALPENEPPTAVVTTTRHDTTLVRPASRAATRSPSTRPVRPTPTVASSTTRGSLATARPRPDRS